MYKGLYYEDFRDIALRLKWYPESFSVLIVCKQRELIQNFSKLITKITDIKPKFGGKDQIRFANNGVLIDIIMNINSARGRRINALIVDSNLSFKEIDEIFVPMLRFPCRDIYLFSRDYILNENCKLNAESSSEGFTYGF